MKLLLVPVFVLSMLLMACAPATVNPDGSPAQEDLLMQLKDAKIADLQAALDTANAIKDPAAISCYTTLIGIVNSIPQSGQYAVKGPVSLFEAARAKVRMANGASALRDELTLGCGALSADLRLLFLRLGLKIAPIPGIPAIGNLLP